MPRARKHLVCLSDTPYYHVTSRCVRRAFLCGNDHYSGKSYEHRRDWIEQRLRVLSSIFDISVCAYAVMSNHYHLIVHLSRSEANQWNEHEVLSRWTTLFRGPLLVQQFLAGTALRPAEQSTVADIVSVYRERLCSLSWFMKCLNEHIARKANAEDRCTGHFWEARFHSQALKTESALISAMAYVDLNPIRANMAKTLDDSDYTSIQSRLTNRPTRSDLAEAIANMVDNGELQRFALPVRPLMGFTDEDSSDNARRLPMREIDYLQLVEITGRIAQPGRKGKIDASIKPILDRLGLSFEDWRQASTDFRSAYRNGMLRSQRTP